MTGVGQDFGSFEALLVALGILDENGNANANWFNDPLGGSSANDAGLKTLLANDGQREALETFVDDVLGAPDRSTRGGVTWVPLFRETSPQVTIYATLKPVSGAVYIGVALEHAMQGSAPTAATSVHVPLFRVPRGTASLSGGGSLPPWLLIGRAEGKIEVSVDLTLRSGAPAPGDASLGGLAVSLGIPTDGSANLALAITLRDLQLPGATAPRTMVLDAASPAELGGEVLELLATLVRAQVDALATALPTQVGGVLGLLGLREVPNLPPLPLADIPTRGIDALVEWVRDVFATTSARTAWLTQLRDILGGAVGTDRVTVTTGALSVSVGVRSATGSGGAVLVTPWVSLALTTGAGAQVQLAVDVLRADLATGAVTAVPDLRAEALFGDQAAGGSALISTGATRVGGLRTGLVLGADRRAAFALTLHNVTIGGRSHPLLDLSSPDAAVDAAESVVTDAIAAALDEFGEAGDLIAMLLGIEPPGAIPPISPAALLSDPLAEVMRYWQALTGSSPAMSEALGALRRLLMNTPLASVPGGGTRTNPWRVELTAPLVLLVWRDGGALLVDASLELAAPVFDGHEVVTSIRGSLLRLQFAPTDVTFVGEFSGSVELRKPASLLALALGPLELTADAVLVRATWSPTRGLLVDVEAPNAVASVDSFREQVEFAVPLPVRNAVTGVLEFPDTAWDSVQQLVASLAAQARAPLLDELLAFIGWTGTGPELALRTLVEGDPALAIRQWLALLVLDCDRVRETMGVFARVLSAGAVRQATGSGSIRDPYRAAIAGEPRAPALVSWLEPPCPPRFDFGKSVPARRAASVVEDGESIVTRLRNVESALPDVRDLLTGRDSLGAGVDALVARWKDTDGITPVPLSITGGVTIVPQVGLSYDDLVAQGAQGLLVPSVASPVPTTVIHVGSELVWTTARPAGRAVDATGAATTGSITAAGTGEWFVRLPTAVAAAGLRADRDGVAEQAERLDRILASRTGAVTLVAYGPCAAAALRVARTRTAVTQVITVGAPFVAPSVTALRTGLSADAMRLLERLVRADVAALPPDTRAMTATPYDVVRDLITRSLAVASNDAALPSAGTEAIRAGLPVRAVFGALDEVTIRRGIAAIVEDGITARFEALRDAAEPLVPRDALHLGADIPVLSTSIGGVFVGAGATLDLVQFARDAAQAITVGTDRSVTVHLHFGITDGWLIGGPSPEPGDVAARWMSAHVTVPFDGSAGDTELVLYEARGLGVFRERWVVRADADGIAATTALPEVRAILSAIVARLRTAAPALDTLLDVAGLLREGGLDADGLDRLLFEPETVAAQIRARAVEAASAIRTLVSGVAGAATSSALTWTIGDATIGLDLGARTFSLALDTVVAETVPCTVSASLAADGRATMTFALGEIDANAGGLRLVGQGGATNTVAIEWRGAGTSPLRTMALLPTPDVSVLAEFASTAAPAFLTQALINGLRDTLRGDAWSAFTIAVDALGMFHDADADGFQRVRLPIALFDDPAAWLANGTAAWRTDPLAQAVALLESLVPILAPGRVAGTGWPIVPGVLSVNYAVAGESLTLTLDAAIDSEIDGADVALVLGAGLTIARDLRVTPALTTSVTVDGTGLALTVAPSVQLSLVRPAPATVLMLYPAGAGLASVLSAVGESVVPPVLNALAARRTDAGAALIKRVGQAVFDLGGALDLRDASTFTSTRITVFAADPAGRLLARLPNLIGLGVATLAQALDSAGTLVAVATPASGVLEFRVGTTNRVTLTLDTTVTPPVMKIGGTLAVPAVGNIVVEELRLASEGVSISVRVGPASLNVGGVTLRPVLVVRAGVTRSGFTRLAALGLGVDAAGVKSAEVRWTLDETPPAFAVVTRSGSAETNVNTDPTQFALSMLSIGASVATGLALPVLDPPAPAPRVLPVEAFTALENVLFVTSGGVRSLDVSFFDDLLQPERLFNRAKRLLWNIATLPTPLGVTIAGAVRIALAALPAAGSRKRLGFTLSLASPTARIALATGDPTVELETYADWITGSPVPAGITLTILEGEVTATSVSLDLVPSFTMAGVGLRFSKAGGPLLNLGDVSLDAIAVHVLAEVSSTGVGGGVNLELAGFAIAPSNAGGNPVAGGILSDASTGSPNNRPSFSPSVAVQQRAGGSLGVSVTAGRPPGPWWLIVQRELGPLYLERLGFDSTTANGQITRFSLLFDGSVSLFGMTAAVDQLSLTWNGGDLFDPSRWSADLRGLAVSADFGGLMLAGGLLKDGENGYLGMLLGRFAAYGITVYGGYAVIDNSPSFFIFGALNGPIGGPPAFFVTGIGAGLGINRQLKVPDDLSQFGDYPFIKALDVAATVSNPMDELRSLNRYFGPQPGQFWVAAGISFTSFALVDGIAVLAVSFGTNGLDINLLGLARMALPRPQVAIVSIELALLARFSMSEGIFSIRAQLTENSWLLYEDVRLTGGFAFAVWWKGPLAGQFVLTIGGYYPGFHRDGYPDVPRLGLTWQVTDNIVIKGGAYFALTSEALMAGVEVLVSADFGWAWAKIEFGGHAIVYFDPFWFEAQAYARISAGVKIKTFLGTIRFSLSTGASLLVNGPDFGGRATFEVGPASVTVPFGSQNKSRGDVIDWPAFVTKYLEDGAGGGARALAAITGLGTLPKKAGGNPADSADGSAAKPYEVFGEFELTVSSTAPIITAGTNTLSFVNVQPTRPDGAPLALGLAPMGKASLTSNLALRLTGLSSEPGVLGDRTSILALFFAKTIRENEAYPIGVWGAPNSLPIPAIPKGDVISALTRLRFVFRTAGLVNEIPPIKYRQVEVERTALPLQARGGVRATMFTTASTIPIPVPASVDAALTRAAATLFTVQPAVIPDGLLPRGNAGAAAKAAFRGDRVAPPMFGNLADGLRRTNAADGSFSRVPTTPKGPAPAVRAPKVTGLLAGGAGVIERGPATTVRDQSLKRRQAPTLDSVRTRLTRSLPVQLARTPRPGAVADGTIIAAGAVPFTAAPGTRRSMAVGRSANGISLDSVVGGLKAERRGARKAAAQSTVHAGDLIVLASPDASIDLDTRRRPTLRVTGQARVTMVEADGTVLLDATIRDSVAVPPRTAMIGVQAGGSVSVEDGLLRGWHERTRVARLSPRLAVAPGCAIVMEGAVVEGSAAWLEARSTIADASAITTRFAATVRTVVVVLTGAAEPNLDGLTLELRGAARVTERDGAARPPRVVMRGSQSVLVYEVAPERAATSVSVRVLPGGQWQLGGVLGSDLAASTVAQSLALRGVVACAGRLLMAADGKPISVEWEAVKLPIGTTPGGKAATTRATGQGATRKKPAAKRSSRTKSAPARTARKKRSAAKSSRTASSRATPARTSTTRTRSSTTARRGGTRNAR